MQRVSERHLSRESSSRQIVADDHGEEEDDGRQHGHIEGHPVVIRIDVVQHERSHDVGALSSNQRDGNSLSLVVLATFGLQMAVSRESDRHDGRRSRRSESVGDDDEDGSQDEERLGSGETADHGDGADDASAAGDDGDGEVVSDEEGEEPAGLEDVEDAAGGADETAWERRRKTT